MKLKSTEEMNIKLKTLRAFGSFLTPLQTYSDETLSLKHSKYSFQRIPSLLPKFIP